MLARILSLFDISVTVFESESSPDHRGQGGTLDLHTDTGIAAMKDAKLFEDFKSKARYDGDYYSITDKRGKPFIQFGSSKGLNERPEIDRTDLRRILIESLPQGIVKWGHRLQRVESGGTLVFEHVTESGFDLVVGCEGVWSKVRDYITPIKPRYSGVGYTLLSVPDAEAAAPELYKLVNRGNLFCHNEGQTLSIQQMGDGSLHVGWASVKPEDWMETCGHDPHDLEEARKAILADLHDWSPSLVEAVEKSQGKCDPKSIYVLPVGFRWEHKQGVTLIGDAARKLSPRRHMSSP